MLSLSTLSFDLGGVSFILPFSLYTFFKAKLMR